MSLDAAMEWLAAQGGKVHLVRRTDKHSYYQIVIPPHRSVALAVEHHGLADVPPTDPEFERTFVELVDDIHAKITAAHVTPERVAPHHRR